MRSGKWYRKNEAELMKKYGMKPTKNSGSGWIEKEDGENEDLICQLKSTETDSIKISLLDLHKLIYHANNSHKIPVFMIQFIDHNEEYILVRPEDIQEAARGLQKNGQYNFISNIESLPEVNSVQSGAPPQKIIKSSSKKSREKFYNDKEKMYEKYKGKT